MTPGCSSRLAVTADGCFDDVISVWSGSHDDQVASGSLRGLCDRVWAIIAQPRQLTVHPVRADRHPSPAPQPTDPSQQILAADDRILLPFG